MLTIEEIRKVMQIRVAEARGFAQELGSPDIELSFRVAMMEQMLEWAEKLPSAASFLAQYGMHAAILTGICRAFRGEDTAILAVLRTITEDGAEAHYGDLLKKIREGRVQ